MHHKRNKMTVIMFDQLVVGLRILSSTSTVERHQTRGANGKLLVSKQCFIAKRLFTGQKFIQWKSFSTLWTTPARLLQLIFTRLYSNVTQNSYFTTLQRKTPKVAQMHVYAYADKLNPSRVYCLISLFFSFPLILFLKF